MQLRAEADRGNPEAQNQMAQYTLSSYDAKDEYLGKEGADYAGLLSRAIALWQKAADQGYAPAQYNLGYMYDTNYHSLNIKNEDEAQKKAVYWYRKAGRQGDGPSGYRIWYIWFRDTVNALHQAKDIGTGKAVGSSTPVPPVSEEEALSWLKHAAERNHEEAKFWLASYYAWDKKYADSGGLTDKSPDYKEAYFWIRVFLKVRRAHDLAHGVDKQPAEFAAHLTEEEIRQVDARVEQWKPVAVPFPQAKE